MGQITHYGFHGTIASNQKFVPKFLQFDKIICMFNAQPKLATEIQPVNHSLDFNFNDLKIIGLIFDDRLY